MSVVAAAEFPYAIRRTANNGSNFARCSGDIGLSEEPNDMPMGAFFRMLTVEISVFEFFY